MKVRFLKSIAGISYSFGAGEETDLPEAKANRLIEYGICEPIKQASEKQKEVKTRPVKKSETKSVKKTKKRTKKKK